MVESFGSALARLRREHRPVITLRRLSEIVHYSHVYLWQIERNLKAVTPEVAARCDRAVGAGGELIAVAERVMAAQATTHHARAETGRAPAGQARTAPAGTPDRPSDPNGRVGSQPVHAQPRRPGQTRTETTHVEPSRADQITNGPTDSRPEHAEPRLPEQTRPEPIRTEPTRAEPTRAEPTRAGPREAEPITTGRAGSEPACEDPQVRNGRTGARRSNRPRCDTALDDLRHARQRFARLYGSNGGVAVRPRLLEYIRNDAEPFLDGSPERCRAIGALVALAAVCAHDAEDHASTARHGTRALELALVSDDAEFIAYVTAQIARQEVERGLAAEALERTERLLRRLPDSVTRVLRAELHQARAEAYAALGDRERSADESLQAHRVHRVQRAAGEDRTPPELIDGEPGALESRYADSLRRLGEPEKAEPYAWAALILGRHAHRRGRVDRLLVLAGILQAVEEPAAAAAKATEALDLVEEMESMRLHRRLRELAAELAPYWTHPGVREFCGRVDGLCGITP